MADSEKINLAQLKERYKKGLRIPEIQRDYVMGSGGKQNKNSKDKLTGLLDAILEKCKAKEDFDFSSIITYCKNNDREDEYLDIYDGQQRLTTLFLLVLYKLRQERNISYMDYKDWYCFSCRPVANEILKILTEENGIEAEALIERMEVWDFTSFSMRKLLKKISEREENGREKYGYITSDYLLHQVKFDKVEIGSQNEIEQFFMDLNSGVKLKEYELYKAKLIHHIGEIKKKNGHGNRREILKSWAYKLDNEWLDAFKTFASFPHPAEEYEMAFIKYCFQMFGRIRGIEEGKDEIRHLDEDLLEDTYHIMQSVKKIDFADIKHKDDTIGDICDRLLYFSWGGSKEEGVKDAWAIGKHNYDKRGVAYSLEFEEYEKQLYWVIQNVLLNEGKDMCSDAVLWCYISTLVWPREKLQKEYLRLVKILLNNNIAYNEDAWYECQKKGQYMYYCRNIVCGIPQYYGMHKEIDCNKNNDTDMIKDIDILSLNARIIKSGKVDKISDRKEDMTFYCMDFLLASEKDKIKDVISRRKSYLESYQGKYSEYLSLENNCLGIGNPDKAQEYLTPDRHFMAKVSLNWPTRKAKNEPLECWIRRQCKIDLICSQFSPPDPRDKSLVDKVLELKKRQYLELHKDEEKAQELAREYINRCLWKEDKQHTYIIRNRKTWSSTTYVANGDIEQDTFSGKYVGCLEQVQ